MRVVRRTKRPDRLFPHFLQPQSGHWEREGTYSLGAFADSFYEYLLKEWLRSGKADIQVRLTVDHQESKYQFVSTCMYSVLCSFISPSLQPYT